MAIELEDDKLHLYSDEMSTNNLYENSLMTEFNDNWSFRRENEDEVHQITLPHSWNSVGWTYEENQNNEPCGTGIYKKEIYGNDLEGYRLKFEGVSAWCEVFLNGVKIHENIGAYRAFEVKLSGLNAEKNLLEVRVTDKTGVEPLPENCDDVFSKSPRYKRWPCAMGSSGKAGGIWRKVYLVKKPETYMNPFVIETSKTKFCIQPDVVGDAADYTIEYIMSDGSENVSGTVCAAAKSFVIEMPNPVLSWPLNPHLYEFCAKLADKSGQIVQIIRQPAQLMRLEVRNSGFRLNDKPYYLRGQNGFAHCNIHYDKEYIKKYVGEYKKLGVEISRFHTEPPAHEWLDECDRQGIMVILEMPLHGSVGCYSFASKEFEQNELTEILNIVKEYRRHPSIAIWSMGNELIVACERDLGLGKDLFDILEGWIAKVRELDSRPIISNSNGDAANVVNKTVGDIDDIHQYGGWYVETLYDLRHFAEYTIKNDMLFQPCISTESIAAYTDNEEKCFVKSGDVRQKKIVAQRLGKITDLAQQSRDYQAFMLKEYAEALWRLRVEGSSFSGYIPFGQYTWFFDPFDKDRIRPKSIWNTYKKVLSPVHVQLECFDRHIYKGGDLKGCLRLWHENIHLPENAKFKITALFEGRVVLEREVELAYHKSYSENVCLSSLNKSGKIIFNVYCGGELIGSNDIEFYAYDEESIERQADVYVYDPENMLPEIGTKITSLDEVDSHCKKLLIGPYAFDKDTDRASDKIFDWISNGGRIAILEQNPCCYTENTFGTQISSARMCQPQWSRWASNLVKHTDRTDICDESSVIFKDVTEKDMFWWNNDTYVADSYLCYNGSENFSVLSQIGNGLASTELMPIKYEYSDSGYSITAMECDLGVGKVFSTSLLIGTKCKIEPVAYKILNNILNWL